MLLLFLFLVAQQTPTAQNKTTSLRASGQVCLRGFEKAYGQPEKGSHRFHSLVFSPAPTGSHRQEPEATLRDNPALRDFCFYGWTIAQWFGTFAGPRFAHVQGMSDWIVNSRALVREALLTTSVQFMGSSGWPVELGEVAAALGGAFQQTAEGGQAAPRAPAPAAWPPPGALRPPELCAPAAAVSGPRRLRAVAVSYHAALLREPLSLWERALGSRFIVDAQVHVLDSASTTKDADAQAQSGYFLSLEGR